MVHGISSSMRYGKQKIKQIHSAVKSKVIHALELETIDLDTTTDDDHHDSLDDLGQLMLLLKDKIHLSTKKET